MPSLAQLGDGVGVSPFHLHRIFKQATGLTPKAYGDDLRATRAQAALAAGDTVTTAIYTAGYGSSSRFYAAAGEHLGMEPSRYRKGGKGAVIRFAVGRSTLGEILVAATEKGICAIFLGDDAQELISALHQRFANAELIGGDPAFDTLVGKAIAAVEAATAGKSQVASLPLDLQGTAFQIRVWHALQEIPRGMTTTYAALADSIGEPKATRAVASACGANPVAVIVPCHRVVRTDGGLGGYRWGLARKEALLERERGEAD